MSSPNSPGPFTVTVDNVIYEAFPTCEGLLEQSTGLIKSFMRFLKQLNIFTREDLMRALSTNDPSQIDRLFCKIHRLDSETPPDGIAKSFSSWQSKKLRGSSKPYRISMVDVIKRTTGRTKFPGSESVKNEVGLILDQLQSKTRSSDEDLLTRAKVDKENVEQLYSSCKLKPIRSWEEALAEPDYLKTILGTYFPDVSCQAFVEYLFGRANTNPQKIYEYCIQHSIKASHRRFDRDYLEEYLAFIKWTGNNVDDFLKKYWDEIWAEDTF